MKPDILLDAMEYIDEDLLNAVEKLRTGGKRYSSAWMRWASLAACVCILAGGVLVWSRLYGRSAETEGVTGSPETMATPTGDEETIQETGAIAETDTIEEGAALWPESSPEVVVPENVQYIRTDGYHEDVQYPVVTMIRSAEELEVYYSANRELYDLERKETEYSDTTIGFLDACDRYDETYFAAHDLLLVLVEEGSGSIRHEVGALTLTEEGWTVDVLRIEPEVVTDDMAQWHLMIEVEKDLIGQDENIRVE